MRAIELSGLGRRLTGKATGPAGRGPDRGQSMRILVLPLLLLASAASAQTAVDCDAVRNFSVPVELAYHARDLTKNIVQVYPGKSGDYVIWSRRMPLSAQRIPPVFVAKAIFVDGLIASGEMSTT